MGRGFVANARFWQISLLVLFLVKHNVALHFVEKSLQSWRALELEFLVVGQTRCDPTKGRKVTLVDTS